VSHFSSYPSDRKSDSDALGHGWRRRGADCRRVIHDEVQAQLKQDTVGIQNAHRTLEDAKQALGSVQKQADEANQGDAIAVQNAEPSITGQLNWRTQREHPDTDHPIGLAALCANKGRSVHTLDGRQRLPFRGLQSSALPGVVRRRPVKET
jgi:hypothetical protein